MSKTSRISALKKSISNLFNPLERQREFQNINQKQFAGFSNSRKWFGVTIGAYVLAGLLHARGEQKLKFKVSATRRISRYTGYLCGMPLPPYLRQYIYLAYGKFYGVNFDEILI